MERSVPLRRDDARLLDEGPRATVQGSATRLLVADDDDAIREMVARVGAKSGVRLAPLSIDDARYERIMGTLNDEIDKSKDFFAIITG